MELKFCLLLLVATVVAGGGMSRSHRPNCRRNLPRICGNGSMDIIFLIDGSNSLKRESFNLAKDVVINFIEGRGVENTRYAVLQISSNVTEEISLNQFSTVQQYVDAIRSIRFYQGGTMTAHAIRFMVEHTLKNRPVYNTKAMVITDGAAQDVENLKTTSDLAKSMGVEMFAIGVEIPQEIREKCLAELRTIASKPKKDHSYLVKDYNRLENKDKIWKNVICDNPCTCNDGYVLTPDKTNCIMGPKRLVPSIVGFQVTISTGSTMVSADWQLVGVTEHYEIIDYYTVTIYKNKTQGEQRTFVLSQNTKDTYFETTDLTLGSSYFIEVIGTTTKGSKTNKVSQEFELQKTNDNIQGECSCEQQMRNQKQMMEKMNDMTSMLRQVLNKVQLLEEKLSFLQNKSERKRKRSDNQK